MFFDQAKISTALAARLGWKQTTGAPVLTEANKASGSGRYFNDGSFHSLVTLKNIQAIIEEVEASDEAFNEELARIESAAINRCLQSVFTDVQPLEQVWAFERYGRQDEEVTNSGLFVGYRIRVAPTDALATIDAVRLLFDGDATFDLYLFSATSKLEVKKQSVTVQGGVLSEEVLSGFDMAPGIYYFGYFQEELGDVQAIDENVRYWNTGKVFAFSPITLHGITASTFSNASEGYTSVNFGLNPSISVAPDYTQKILRRIALFDEAIGLQVAAQVVEQVVYTTRINGTETLLKEGAQTGLAMMDLKGTLPIQNAPRTTSLAKRIEAELEKVRKGIFSSPQAQSLPVC